MRLLSSESPTASGPVDAMGRIVAERLHLRVVDVLQQRSVGGRPIGAVDPMGHVAVDVVQPVSVRFLLSHRVGPAARIEDAPGVFIAIVLAPVVATGTSAASGQFILRQGRQPIAVGVPTGVDVNSPSRRRWSRRTAPVPREPRDGQPRRPTSELDGTPSPGDTLGCDRGPCSSKGFVPPFPTAHYTTRQYRTR